ncbi:hypothetical protein Ahy_B06g084090 [Arachis hypogaea]|uniref:GRF-type domain-containing protein n=1 Tax=Arachis hypogaea TaxID=3818 RepID=A0A444YQZ6_ARAHY|nr:hypothetical protein Ahy_B06g084090 [Arachis hypogaea]
MLHLLRSSTSLVEKGWRLMHANLKRHTAASRRHEIETRRTTCYCGERPVLATSLTAENSGRRFWGCVNFGIGEECGYFVWAEQEEEPPQVSRLRMKVRNLKSKMEKVEFRFIVAVGVALVGWTVALILVCEKTSSTKFGRLLLQ